MARRWVILLALVAMSVVCRAQNAPALTYEVVSIKPDKTGGWGVSINTNDDSYTGTNVSLKMLIEDAYALRTDAQIAGVPGWADSARYDVMAKMDAETVAALKKQTHEERNASRREMMQALLAERFGFKYHQNTKVLPVYAMVVAKSGSKLKDADPNDTAHQGSMNSNNGNLTATGVTMEQVARHLSYQVDRMVEDKTGLAGKYDFTLHWTRDEQRGESKDSTGLDSGPSIYAALEEQLGLKLDATKDPMLTIVVDHVDQPSGN